MPLEFAVMNMLKKIKAVDEKLIQEVAKLHTPILNRIMLFLTFLGDGGKIWFLMIAIILYIKRSLIIGISLLLGLGLGILMAEGIIKRIVCRVRPCHKIDEDSLILKKMPHFYSFPSSHSSTSFAMVSASFLVCEPWMTTIIFIFALGVAFSRFYLQAHYLTDVLCGIALGIACGIVTVKLVYLIAAAINPAFVK